MFRNSIKIGLLIFLIPCGLQLGCSGKIKTYPVTGKVTFEDGSPVKFGQIEFQSSQHPITARGKIQRDGTFMLGTYAETDGAVAGEHSVVIVQFVVNHMNVQVEHDHGHLVDRKYASYDSTDLTAEVDAASANQIDLKVTVGQ